MTADWRLQPVKPPICRVLGLARGYGAGEKRIKRAEPFLPMLPAILLYGIELRLISRSAPAIRNNLDRVPVMAGVTSMLTAANLALVYLLTKRLRLPERQARAIMFDVGVDNAGLGAVLAGLNVGPLSVLPPLLNSVMIMIIGALLAAFLRNPVSSARPRAAGGDGLVWPAA